MLTIPLLKLEKEYPYLPYYLDDFEVEWNKEKSFSENLLDLPESFFEHICVSFRGSAKCRIHNDHSRKREGWHEGELCADYDPERRNDCHRW